MTKEMEFTFGIVTNGGDLQHLIQSIRMLQIPSTQYEIIIVGAFAPTFELKEDVVAISFDETQKEGWITRKKNMICERAKFENIVLMHDYMFVHPDFYTGFLKFGNDWEVCVTQIKNADGSRYRDYIFFPYYPWWKASLKRECNKFLLPYWMKTNKYINRFQYISGSVYCVKKTTALQHPLDETLCWGQGEDVQFSNELANHRILMKCNPYSTIQFMKYKVRAFCCDTDHVEIHELKEFLDACVELEQREPDFFTERHLHLQK